MAVVQIVQFEAAASVTDSLSFAAQLNLGELNKRPTALQIKNYVLGGVLGVVEKVNQSVGFTLSGGIADNKTLTVSGTCSVNQSLLTSDTPGFVGLNLVSVNPAQINAVDGGGGVGSKWSRLIIGRSGLDFSKLDDAGDNPVTLFNMDRNGNAALTGQLEFNLTFNNFFATLAKPAIFGGASGGAGSFANGDLILQSRGTAASAIRFATSNGTTMTERMRFNSDGTALVNTKLYFGSNGSGNYAFSCGENTANYKFAFYEAVGTGHFMYGFGADNLGASTGGVGMWSGTASALATRANAALFFDRNDLPSIGPQFMVYSDFMHGIKDIKLLKWQIAEAAYNYADIANSQGAIYHNTGTNALHWRGKKADGTQYDYALGGTGGTGDVTGPANSNDNGLVIFNGTGGKTIKRTINATFNSTDNLLTLAADGNANDKIMIQKSTANAFATIDAYRNNSGSPAAVPIRMGTAGSHIIIRANSGETFATTAATLTAETYTCSIGEVLHKLYFFVCYADGTTKKYGEIELFNIPS